MLNLAELDLPIATVLDEQLEEVAVILERQLASDMSPVNALCRHVEQYRCNWLIIDGAIEHTPMVANKLSVLDSVSTPLQRATRQTRRVGPTAVRYLQRELGSEAGANRRLVPVAEDIADRAGRRLHEVRVEQAYRALYGFEPVHALGQHVRVRKRLAQYHIGNDRHNAENGESDKHLN